jgi:hypothetical protein
MPALVRKEVGDVLSARSCGIGSAHSMSAEQRDKRESAHRWHLPGLGDLLHTGTYARRGEIPPAPADWWSRQQIEEAIRRHAVDGEPPTASEWYGPPYRDAREWFAEVIRDQHVVPDEELQRRLYHPDYVSRPVTTVVDAQFKEEAARSTWGTWNCAVTAAGLTPRHQGQKREREYPTRSGYGRFGSNRQMVTGEDQDAPSPE